MPKSVRIFKYAEIKIGQKAEFNFLISADFIKGFIKLSGDRNPLHADKKYAKKTEFGQPLAHGMIAGLLFSRLIGMELPGKYSLYLSQTFNFHQPMFYGQKIRVCGQVDGKTEALGAVTILTKILDASDGRVLADGRAIVKLLK